MLKPKISIHFTHSILQKMCMYEYILYIILKVIIIKKRLLKLFKAKLFNAMLLVLFNLGSFFLNSCYCCWLHFRVGWLGRWCSGARCYVGGRCLRLFS